MICVIVWRYAYGRFQVHRGKRLIITGHSLGGGIAQVVTLALLERLKPEVYEQIL